MAFPEVSAEQREVSSMQAVYSRFYRKKFVFLAALFTFLIFCGVFATMLGSVNLSAREVMEVLAARIIPSSRGSFSELAKIVVIDLRLPRIFLAVVTGISLAGAGVVMQGILNNPLVCPYTLGLSGGAAFGAALAIVLGASVLGPAFGIVGRYLIVTNAFLFGFLTMFLVYGIARLKGSAPETLVLGGVAIGYLFSAGVSGLKYFSDSEALKELVVWLMGGLWGASWSTIGLLFPIVTVCMLVLLRYAWDMNALAAGEEVAANLGVKVNRLRLISLAFSALAASATVAFTGIIGFIGLIAPHFCRMLIGGDYRFLIPCSCLMGATLLLVSDTLARTIIAPVELPVGIITSLIGAPFFVFLLVKKKRRWWS